MNIIEMVNASFRARNSTGMQFFPLETSSTEGVMFVDVSDIYTTLRNGEHTEVRNEQPQSVIRIAVTCIQAVA